MRKIRLIDLFLIKMFFPDNFEKDPIFQKSLSRASRLGILVAGNFAIVIPLVHIFIMVVILGKKLVFISHLHDSTAVALFDKLLIISLGIFIIVLSRIIRFQLKGARFFVFILVIMICLLSIYDDVHGDPSQAEGYLILIMLGGVAAVTFRPSHVFLLGALIILSFYLFPKIIISDSGMRQSFENPTSYVFLVAGTLMVALFAGYIYNVRYRQFDARQKEALLRQEVQVYAHELEEKNIEIQETQAQLIQSEKMASLGNLVAGVAHEVNTPLGVISSNADTSQRVLKVLNEIFEELNQMVSLDERQKKARKIIEVLSDMNQTTTVASSRIGKIVRALRGFAHLDEAELQEINLHKGIDDTITLLTINPEIQVEIERDFSDIPDVSCRPGQLNQVFMNILTNALEAIDKKGKITISTRAEKQWIMIRISDTGHGISPKDLKHIFDPGFTTKGVGVGIGLGLSICYRNISDHKGTIEVESTEGVGTTFTIRIPRN